MKLSMKLASLRRCLACAAVATLACSATAARADAVPTGARASAARAEAEAFVALEEKRDCDAARSFLRAHALAPDDRLVVNAALALERHGAPAQALRLFESVRGTPAAVVADVDARIAALAGATDSGAVCLDTTDDVIDEAAPSRSAFLPAGITALASGLVVAGSTAGTVVWLDAVIDDATSAGGARLDALTARDPVLWAGTSIASVLVVAGAVLVPLSFVEELQ
jgi:hypothetical protein